MLLKCFNLNVFSWLGLDRGRQLWPKLIAIVAGAGIYL